MELINFTENITNFMRSILQDKITSIEEMYTSEFSIAYVISGEEHYHYITTFINRDLKTIEILIKHPITMYISIEELKELLNYLLSISPNNEITTKITNIKESFNLT